MTAAVTLSFEADTRNVALARTVAATMAARADLPLDQLEDVRLAVDEAVSQAILAAPRGGVIDLEFLETPAGLDITVRAPSSTLDPPPTDTFSWMVLSALVDRVSAVVEDGQLRLDLQVVRGLTVDA